MLLDEFLVAIERLEKLDFDPRLDGPGCGASAAENVCRRLVHLAEGLETIHWKTAHQNRAAVLATRARASAQRIAQQHALVHGAAAAQALGSTAT